MIDEAIAGETPDRAFDPLEVGRRDEAKQRRWLGGGAVTEAATLLMRAEAFGEVSEASLRTVYSQWERGHFANEIIGNLLF